jgi:hypothetical protein
MRQVRSAPVLFRSFVLAAVAACNPADPMNGNGEGGGPGSQDGSGGSGGAKRTGGSSGAGPSGSSGGSGGAVAAGGSGGSMSAGSGGGSGAGGGSGGASGSGGGGAGGGSATGGSGGSPAPDGGKDAAGSAEAGSTGDASTVKFSFFYTSLNAMRRLSKSQNGFGGDLRFGMPTGIEGADKICQTIAEDEGIQGKTWRAFLSATKGPDGQPVNAIDRVGQGPWYDRMGRLIAMNKAGLTSGNRPAGDAQAVNDLPDETGQGTKRLGDTHDAITGSNAMGQITAGASAATTCMDWTSVSGSGPVIVGHAWPAGSGMNWIRAHTERSCAAGVNLVQNGPGNGSSIGSGGGWGGFYCFALTP